MKRERWLWWDNLFGGPGEDEVIGRARPQPVPEEVVTLPITFTVEWVEPKDEDEDDDDHLSS